MFVSKTRLISRIRRVLAKEGLRLRTSRGDACSTLGQHFLVNQRRHVMVTDVDLVELARNLGVLRENQVVG